MGIKEIKAEEIKLSYRIEKSTKDVKPERIFPGQKRVEKAFDIALKTDKEGYNIYVAGPEGIGKLTYTLEILKKEAEEKTVPEDVCYYFNFEEPQKPKFLLLPAGYGKKLSKSLEQIIETLKESTVKQFESKEFEDERVRIIKEIEEKRKDILKSLQEEAATYGLAVVFTPAGIQFLPIVHGKPSPEALAIPEIKTEFEKKVELFDEKFREYLRQLRELDIKLQEQLKELREKVSSYIVENAFYKVEQDFKNIPDIIQFLNYLKEKVSERIDIFIRWKALEGNFLFQKAIERDLNMFRINVVVDNGSLNGAPVVHEELPTFKSLFGHISYTAEMGILYADHMSLIAGSLLKSRGGFLILRAFDIIKNPALWEALKRVLLHKKIYISQIPFEEFFPFHVGIHPEPVPFKAKLAILGNTELYEILSFYDEEFNRIFKVKGEFDPVIDITEELVESFPKIIKKIKEDEKLKDFSNDALTELFRYGVVLSGSRKKFNMVFSYITDIARESDALSQKEIITGEDVKRAIKEKIFRSNLLEEKIKKLFKEGKLIINIDGKETAQVNGISVYELGDFSFGKPSRITASSYIGEKGIINIEREVELSGPIHDKGVMILSGYIGKKYGKDTPLALSCSITFEQSYGEVEGDSASAAELLAVLSSISEIPVRQDIAITGSIDQHGNIQPVGGIKEKIEGFYRICKILGLTGKQGVIVPSRNFDNIILDEEVLESVEKGEFHIYTVDNIDDVIKIMTGIEPLEFHRITKENLAEFYEKIIKGKK